MVRVLRARSARRTVDSSKLHWVRDSDFTRSSKSATSTLELGRPVAASTCADTSDSRRHDSSPDQRISAAAEDTAKHSTAAPTVVCTNLSIRDSASYAQCPAKMKLIAPGDIRAEIAFSARTLCDKSELRCSRKRSKPHTRT